MRLMCPNCDAEYSVDDAAIPLSGRDVQCSNCGHAWFQFHPEAERRSEPADARFGATAAERPDRDGATPSPAPETAVAAAPAPRMAAPDPAPAPAEAVAGLDIETAPPLPPEANTPDEAASDAPLAEQPDDDAAGATVVQMHPAAPPPTRTLDENLLAILREEAARETAVRRAEAPGMPEVQPDLGLSAAAHASVRETAPPPAAAPDTPAAADLDAMEAGSGSTDRAAPRRDLLPDIEEINSTLRAGNEARGAEAEAMLLAEKARNKGGFRAGFILTLVLMVLLTAAYTMAPRIAEHLPGSAPVMASYVEGVDVARVWLDDTLQKAVGALRGLTGEAP